MIVRVVKVGEVTAVFEWYPGSDTVYLAIAVPRRCKEVTATGPVANHRRWLERPDPGLHLFVGRDAAEEFRRGMLAAVAEIETALTASQHPRQENNPCRVPPSPN